MHEKKRKLIKLRKIAFFLNIHIKKIIFTTIFIFAFNLQQIP